MNHPDDPCASEFTHAMMRRYASEIPAATGYHPRRVVQMIGEHGGVGTIRILIDRYPDHQSDGYAELWLAGRLDLSFEAMMLESKWSDLFSDDELQWARTGLEERGFDWRKIR